MVTKEKILNYKQMLIDINKLVANDWTFDIDYLLAFKDHEWSQEQAEKVAKTIMAIFRISHGVYGGCCNHQYYIIKSEPEQQ